MLPIIFIFENHSLPVARDYIIDALPGLKRKGYNTVAHETPKGAELRKMLVSMKTNLSDLNQTLVEIKKLTDQGIEPPPPVQQQINMMKIQRQFYPSMIGFLKAIEQNKFDFVGIDNEQYRSVAINPELADQLDKIRPDRDKNMTDNLMDLIFQQKNVIALVGLNHAKGIQDHLYQIAPEVARNAVYIYPFNDKLEENAVSLNLSQQNCRFGVEVLNTVSTLQGYLEKKLEKALRNAAAKGQDSVVKELMGEVDNKDAQDENPNSLKTALHWAILNNKIDCAFTLIQAGAKYDIPDAKGKSAHDYAVELQRKEILLMLEEVEENKRLGSFASLTI